MMPATTSTTMKATISARPVVRRRVSASSETVCDVAVVAVAVVVAHGPRVALRARRRAVARVRRDLAAGGAEDAAAERSARRGRRRPGRSSCSRSRATPTCRAPLPRRASCSWSCVVLVVVVVLHSATVPTMPRVILDGHNDLALRVWQGLPPKHVLIDLRGRGRTSPAGSSRCRRSPTMPDLPAEAPLRGAARRLACRSSGRAQQVGEQLATLESLDVAIARVVDDIVPGRVNAIVHFEGAEPIAPDLSNLEDWYDARAALARHRLVAAERLRRGRAVPVPGLARHRRRADRRGARPRPRVQLPRDHGRRLAPEREGLLGRRRRDRRAGGGDALEPARALRRRRGT